MKNDVKKAVYCIPLLLMDKSYFPYRSPGSSQIVSYVENVALDEATVTIPMSTV